MTTLRNFVSAAIEQFLGGVLDAQKSDVGAYVAPQVGFASDAFTGVVSKPVRHGMSDMYTTLQFDVAVTADSETSASDEKGKAGSAKGGLNVLGMDLGLGGDRESKAGNAARERRENVSRVQFAVHVKLPTPPKADSK